MTNKYINLYILYLGDLLPIGQIKSVGSGMIFSNPSAWAIHCKKSVNPAKRSGMLRVYKYLRLNAHYFGTINFLKIFFTWLKIKKSF